MYFLFSKYLRQFQQKLLVFLPSSLLPFFFSSFTSLLCGKKTPISSLLIGNVDTFRFFVAGLKNGLPASVVLSVKEYKKSLKAEVKV